MIPELSSLSKEQLLALVDSLSSREALAILYDWKIWARPNQLPPPGDWFVWLVLAGRGFGKTRSGAEWVRMHAEADPNARIAIICPTASDTRDVAIEGESGLINACSPLYRPTYNPSLRRVTFPNGAIAIGYSADEPDRLRGPQHTQIWCDELTSWRYPETWDMATMGLRLGKQPQAMVTTTPKPLPILKEIMADPKTVMTRGSTYDNMNNLAPAFLDQIRKRYEHTRLGRQELYAEVLEDIQNALWKRSMIRYKEPDSDLITTDNLTR